ncbi:MAG: purine-binding chemotaxis protein CheW [Planctomycetes bacterium]|nr:purine-binding chemotaxis protein CheW [Planctomycetota bacterium]
MIAPATVTIGAEGPTLRVCAFQVSGRWFAIDAARIHEVLRSQKTTPVPLAHPAVRGLLNLRGRIVPVIDMRIRLGLAGSAADTDSAGTFVVVEVDDEAFSLLVDRLADVVEIPLAAIEPATTADRPGQDAIEGVWPARFGLVHLLDTARLVAAIAVSAAERKGR